MRKPVLYIALLTVMLTFLLSGCIQIDIDTGIDTDFTSYLSYRIAINTDEIDLQYQDILLNALNRIGWHYQENLGFSVEIHTETVPCLLIMTRRVENNSFEHAFETLEDMLTNENMTLFMQVDSEFQSYERQNMYMLSAVTDIPQIMRLSNAEDLSPLLQDQLEEAKKSGEGTITLKLPASELVSSSHPANILNNQAYMTVPLSYKDEVSFELTGVLNLLRDGTPGGSLEEITNELIMFRNIGIVACCAALVLLLITLLIAKLAKKR